MSSLAFKMIDDYVDHKVAVQLNINALSRNYVSPRPPQIYPQPRKRLLSLLASEIKSC
ncbi:predicted protein [Botrytis cinerea T4]|uniref:Uncharacterized protein n=1 Tax=Botryotinia fuckeliana (strain T4) TaxID=999810 RepID=G2YWQ2_BOTF4|nr:predicted protein [Botrytis cinerea T4]